MLSQKCQTCLLLWKRCAHYQNNLFFQGNIKKWLKKVGDKVKPGDVLVGIETDKATVDFEMQEDGYVAKLMFPDGAKDVPLGTVIAILVENKSMIASFETYGSQAAPAKAASAQAAPAKAAAAKPASNLPDHVRLEMPNLSPTMEKVNL